MLAFTLVGKLCESWSLSRGKPSFALQWGVNLWGVGSECWVGEVVKVENRAVGWGLECDSFFGAERRVVDGGLIE